MEQGQKIILFDGVCNLCNGVIQFIIKRDKKDIFRYAPLQSELGLQMTADRGIDTTKIDSFILIVPGEAYHLKSSAALEIAKSFGGFWMLLGLFGWIPSSIRDTLYDFIARNRYRWFGQQSECMIPTPELKAKFLS
ncbi:MAG: thiol-disulfide oxidoreductase DCC family protein [Bacteroidota bacterium]